MTKILQTKNCADPKVSIIIPVYNVEKYIERCIQSILSQTSNEWEAIIVNDGSTDDSLNIIHGLIGKDPRFRVINKSNGGAASARNVGLEEARSEYITFVDSDDSLEKTYVETLLGTMQSASCDIILSGMRVRECDRLPGIVGLHKFNPFLFFKYCDGGPCAKLFRKEIIDAYHIRFPEDMAVAEDLVFLGSYTLHVKTYFVVPQILYYYYLDNDSSLMHRFWRGELSLNAYKYNVEAPWRIFKLLTMCHDVAKSTREQFVRVLYGDLWGMYHASLRFLDSSKKNEMTIFFEEKHKDFEKELSLWKRICVLQRYPRLGWYVYKIENCLFKLKMVLRLRG